MLSQFRGIKRITKWLRCIAVRGCNTFTREDFFQLKIVTPVHFHGNWCMKIPTKSTALLVRQFSAVINKNDYWMTSSRRGYSETQAIFNTFTATIAGRQQKFHYIQARFVKDAFHIQSSVPIPRVSPRVELNVAVP